ncbi:MAG: hypothetical protein V1721_01020 [Pseudomonadota bacterium]
MKKTIRFAVFVLALSACSLPMQGAWAQDVSLYETQSLKQEPSQPDYVALLFYKMTAQIPDFDSWARQTPAYKEATVFTRMMVLEQKIREMKDGYNRLSLLEPLIVEIPVRLSEYSTIGNGFFIENFKTDTFFPVTHNDRSYAIIPEGIVDKQWLKVSTTEAARTIEAAARSDEGRLLMMTLFLSPVYADKKTPVSLDGREYWLILTDVKKMILTPLKTDTLLWQSDSASFRDEKSQKLLDLYR